MSRIGSQQMPASESRLSIAVSREGGDTVLVLDGELDVYTATQFRERVNDLVYDSRLHLVVDMADLNFVDSTGLGSLVGELARVSRGGGDMVLRSPTAAVRRTIEIVGLERALPIRG
jgi:anti-sigma B factor antagonist